MASGLIRESAEVAVLLDLGVFSMLLSGMAVRAVPVACLCCWRESTVCARFTSVCTCHAWGRMVYQLVRRHGWVCVGVIIDCIHLTKNLEIWLMLVQAIEFFVREVTFILLNIDKILDHQFELMALSIAAQMRSFFGGPFHRHPGDAPSWIS